MVLVCKNKLINKKFILDKVDYVEMEKNINNILHQDQVVLAGILMVKILKLILKIDLMVESVKIMDLLEVRQLMLIIMVVLEAVVPDLVHLMVVEEEVDILVVMVEMDMILKININLDKEEVHII